LRPFFQCVIVKKNIMVRVRFAPSPTGYLHIGAARTAFFNWLFARHYKGKLVLRIEDTDIVRSSEQMSSGIIEGLKWLGINWDEGPFFQSKRMEIYREKARELIQGGKAYYCYCLPEEIQKRKEEAVNKGNFWRYDRRCFRLTEREKKRFESEGRPKAVRFFVPEGEVKYRDLVHGLITVKNRNIEDFVLLRNDGFPTYHLSVVVDDIKQRITHIIRGDDHISNTPKQILLYKAFGSKVPEFAHLALILGQDRKKLSKRHGVTSVLQFKHDGYLPLAVLNFLAQMSWSLGEKERICSVEEMTKKFSLEKLSKGSPVFNLSKLDWLNSQSISRMKARELSPLVREVLKEENLWKEDLGKQREEWFFKLIEILKERCHTIREFALSARPFLSDDFPYDREGIIKHLRDERLSEILEKLKKDFFEIENFEAYEIERVLRQRAENEGVKAALLIHALRMLVLGVTVSPGIFEVLEVVGKDKTLERMGKLSEIVRSN